MSKWQAEVARLLRNWIVKPLEMKLAANQWSQRWPFQLAPTIHGGPRSTVGNAPNNFRKNASQAKCVLSFVAWQAIPGASGEFDLPRNWVNFLRQPSCC